MIILFCRARSKAIESTDPSIINTWTIDYIKEQRMPRAVK